MHSHSNEEIKLSDSCEQLLKVWYSSSLLEEKDEAKFWDSFKQFYNHANKSKGRYKIEYLVDRLADLKANVESAWQKKKTYAELRSEEEREYSKKILLLFSSIISEVENIKEKSLEIEGKKTEKISAKWAGQFLTNYYNIIASAESINSMISVMDADAVTGYENRKVLNARLVAYQTQLLSIAKEIEFLKKLENPQSINELLSSIYHNTQDLLDSFKKDPYSDPYKIISRYQELDFLGGVKLLYREVMNMITNPKVVLE